MGKNCYPNDVDVFQFIILVISSMQDNHKSLFVVLDLQNVLNCGKNIGNHDYS